MSGLFDVDPTGSPVLPYAGTSGWSGSDTSRERAERDDVDGTTSRRQGRVIFALANEGVLGMTVKELRAEFGWHHGQASGVLSVLHKVGSIDRLVERRDRCAVYVLPQFRLGRDAVAHGRKPRAEDEADLIRDAYDEGRRDGRADAFETDAYKALIAESTLLRAAATERHATEAILADLIAELRVMGGEYDSGWAPLIPVADRAEARLREIGDAE